MFEEVNDFFKERFNLGSLDISSGNCYHWAFIVASLYEGAELVTVKECGGHGFIKYEGEYYDSINTDGVANWWDLDYFENDPPDDGVTIDVQTKDDFLSYWRENGCYGWMVKIINEGVIYCKNQ